MSINYKRLEAGKYTTEINGTVYHVERLLSGSWVIFTLDRSVREYKNSKKDATVWLYNNIAA